MTLRKKIEKLRDDTTTPQDDRVWKALVLIAAHIDDNDDLDVLGAIFGAD